MSPWLTTSIAAFAALGVAIYALFSGARSRRLEPEAPTWLVPLPDDVADLRFPLAFNGYDPAHVDAILDPLLRAYAALYEAADAETIARAHAVVAPAAVEIAAEPDPEPAPDEDDTTNDDDATEGDAPVT